MEPNANASTTADDVRDHYSKRIEKGADVSKTCSRASCMPDHVREAVKLVHDDVTSRYYGCGLVIPECLEGTRILDLGCGAGQDCYTLSKLVGETGHVIGLDMTPEMLNIARKYIDYHTEKFKYKTPNVEFLEGFIENLTDAGVKEASCDIIVSNCVICLSGDKRKVFEAAYKALKYGGEMYFSDMYVDRVIPEEVKTSKALWGEGLTGSLYWPNLVSLAKKVGFETPRVVQARRYRINGQDSVYDYNLNGAQYIAVTYRLFKLDQSQQRPSAQVASYSGGIPHHGCKVAFDYHNIFHKDEPRLVDDSLASILKQSRLNRYFSFSSYTDFIDPFDVADKQNNPMNVNFSPATMDGAEEFFTAKIEEN